MWQKQLKTTLQDVLGQLLKYGVAWSGAARLDIVRAHAITLVFAFTHWCIATVHHSIHQIQSNNLI